MTLEDRVEDLEQRVDSIEQRLTVVEDRVLPLEPGDPGYQPPLPKDFYQPTATLGFHGPP